MTFVAFIAVPVFQYKGRVDVDVGRRGRLKVGSVCLWNVGDVRRLFIECRQYVLFVEG